MNSQRHFVKVGGLFLTPEGSHGKTSHSVLFHRCMQMLHTSRSNCTCSKLCMEKQWGAAGKTLPGFEDSYETVARWSFSAADKDRTGIFIIFFSNPFSRTFICPWRSISEWKLLEALPVQSQWPMNEIEKLFWMCKIVLIYYWLLFIIIIDSVGNIVLVIIK